MWSFADDVNYPKLFDEKTALHFEYQYKGSSNENGEKWRIQTHGYLVSRCPALMAILDWAQKSEQPVTQQSLDQQALIRGWPTNLDYCKLNGAVWGFLVLCLKDKAKARFGQARMLNGLEAWRLVVIDIHRGRDIHISTLRDATRKVIPMRGLEEIGNGITRYDNLVRDLTMAGGDRPGDQEMKQVILEALPSEVMTHVMWEATDPKFTYQAFTENIRRQANGMVYMKSKVKRSSPAALVQERDPDTQEYPEDVQEELNAVLQRRGFVPRPRGARPPPRRDAPGPGDRKPKCANCGSEEHTKEACPKPRVDFSQRPCHKCGKPGHLARDCRGGKPAGGAGPKASQPG